MGIKPKHTTYHVEPEYTEQKEAKRKEKGTSRDRKGCSDKRKHNGTRKWNVMNLVHIYRMARMGMAEIDICRNLKPSVSKPTFWYWKKEHPEVREVLELARKERAEGESIASWVYARLSPELKKVWEDIQEWEEQDDGLYKIELMLQEQGRVVRQQLFLYALCDCDFSPTKAMRRVNISKRELDRWIETDIKFAELVEEIQWHKGNFFEEALVKLVKEGDTGAVMFANKTFNKQRGYAPTSKLEVDVSGRVLHGVLDLSILMPHLSETAKLELLQAIRITEEQEQPPRIVSSGEKLAAQIENLPD